MLLITLENFLLTIDLGELNDLGEITTDAFNYIRKLSADNSCTKEITDFAIEYFGNSHSFDNSQKRFNRIILNIVDQISLEQTEKILELSDDNNQIYQSFGMRAKIQTLAEKYDGKFDTTKYTSIYPK